MMQPHEAEELAKRIINLWRLTPPLHEWRTYLEPKNAARATRVTDQLAVTIDGAMSIARYHAAYRQDLADEQRHREPDHQPTYDNAIPWHDPRARTAYERNYRLGQCELWGISYGKQGAEPVTVEEEAMAEAAAREAHGPLWRSQ